jgi:acetate kinase
LHLLREPGTTAPDLERLVNRDAGLLGVSGTSSDMRDLLAREATDPQSATAIDLFCYLAKKSLGGLIVSLGGLDTLIFTGGIGEHSPPIRDRIARGLEWMGLSIDPERNASAADTISTDASTIVVRVIKTNEDLMLARHAVHLLRSS